MPGVPPARYAYLGPAGTFTEEALRHVPAASGSTPELEPCTTVPAALDAVRRGDATAAVVPIENSVEGAVSATLDELATGEPLVITREVLLPIRFVLAARHDTSLDKVGVLATHPHAAAQCRGWLAEHLPDVQVIPSSSTAAAAADVAGGEGYDAAVASPLAVEHYGLDVLADNIGDRTDAVTRFVLVSRPSAAALTATGADRTSLAAFIRDDHPGALLEILTEFSVRGVNLTRIDSRPTGNGHGRYCFSIDCEGHVLDHRVGEALSALRRICADVRYLGSYPRADNTPPTVRGGTTDADYRDAAAWLTQIRTGRL
ncbi:MAG: prephenate dehydratase [Streptosporangiales bacterium]|nr:prephenate dehydratase [Streptosporangiales bacterium]